MAIEGLESSVQRTREERAAFETLSSDRTAGVAGSDAIERDVLAAIDGMQPGTAMGSLLQAPSDDHCPSTSCGISSI
jgi:hypothetical protein